MRKVLVFAFMGLVVSTGYTQGPLNRALLNRRAISPEEAKFKQENPSGTNVYGRTWKVQCEYDKFMKEHPDGKNRFGKTFEEQLHYEKDFDIRTFLGFRFGEHCSAYAENCEVGSEGDCNQIYRVKLSKPFRLFDRVSLAATVKRRLARIVAEKDIKDVSQECLAGEVLKLVALFEKQYKIEFRQTRTGEFYFKNEHIEIITCFDWDKDIYSGDVMLQISKEHLYSTDKELRIKEKQNASKGFDIPADEGIDLMIATTPNLTSNSTENVNMPLQPLPRSRRQTPLYKVLGGKL